MEPTGVPMKGKQPEISGAMEVLRENVIELGKAIEGLKTRIAPVLSESVVNPSSGPKEDPTSPYSSELATAIYENSRSIAGVVSDIFNVKERVEL